MLSQLDPQRLLMAQDAKRSFYAQAYDSKWLFVYQRDPGALPVGALRNSANAGCGEIICHWDDDDWSHPLRIAEQVALLESSGADAVGYDDMIFWDGAEAWQYFIRHPGKALGTSLMYWTKTWERVPFQPFASGEDTDWCGRVKVATASSIVDGVPRMIARIHAGNARNPAYSLAERQKNAALPYPLWQWRRAPEYDRTCKETFL